MKHRRPIATYDQNRMLVLDLCEINHDEQAVCGLLNLADLLSVCFFQRERCRLFSMCSPDHCVEVEAVVGGFWAYEVIENVQS
jgi:hypothetical protein